jgi:hypothetical protein
MLKQLLDSAKRYTVWISFDTNSNEQKIWDLQRAIYETQAACKLQESAIANLNKKIRYHHK